MRFKTGVFLLPIATLFAVSCASASLPPRITRAQRAESAITKFPLTVGVAEDQSPVYSRSLVKALQRTGLFERVDHASSFTEPPDLIASVRRHIHGAAVIPVATLLSLGIIPTTVGEEHGLSFSLQGAENSNSLPIEFSYRGPTTLGWVALPFNLLPARIYGDPRDHEAFVENVRWAIVSRKAEILALPRQ